MTDTSKREDIRIINPHEGAASLVVHAVDGRVLLAIHRDGTVTGAVEDASEAGARFVAYLRAHVFEKAHTPTTPTDDEREALADRLTGDILDAVPDDNDMQHVLELAAAALRRTAVQEPSADEAEPSDAEVHAGAVAIDPAAWEPGIFYWQASSARDNSLELARAALRAAYEEGKKR